MLSMWKSGKIHYFYDYFYGHLKNSYFMLFWHNQRVKQWWHLKYGEKIWWSYDILWYICMVIQWFDRIEVFSAKSEVMSHKS